MAGCVEGIRRALVLGLVLIAGTAIEQASSVGSQHIPSPSRLSGETSWIIALNYYIHVFFRGKIICFAQDSNTRPLAFGSLFSLTLN